MSDLNSTATVDVTFPQGGGSKRAVPVSELNTLISAEETAILATLTPVATEFKESVATATAASAVLTSDTTAVTNGSEVTVNDVTYTFVTALTSPATIPNEVLIGADAEASLINLKKAINGEATEGTNYSTGTEQPTDVTAETTSTYVMTVNATTKGVAGNAYPKATDDAHLDWDGTGAVFTGGIDGTIAAQGKVYVTASKLYVAIDDCTATDSNWKTITYD